MTDQSTMYCMICGAVAPCDAHTYHGQAPCRSNPMPETTLDPWSVGYFAFERGAARIPPSDLSLSDKIEWTAGYDHAWRGGKHQERP